MLGCLLLNIVSAVIQDQLTWNPVSLPLDLKCKYTLIKYDVYDGLEIRPLDILKEEDCISVIPCQGFSRIYLNKEVTLSSLLFYNGQPCLINHAVISLFIKLNVLFRSTDDSRKRILKNILPNKKCLKVDYTKFKYSSDTISLIMLKYHFMGQNREEYLLHYATSLQSIICDLFNVKLTIRVEDIFNVEYNMYYELLDNIILPYDVLDEQDYKAPRTFNCGVTILRFDISKGFYCISLESQYLLELTENKKLEISGSLLYQGMQKIYYKEENKVIKSSCLLYNNRLFDISRLHLLELAIKLNIILKCDENERHLLLANNEIIIKNIISMFLSEPCLENESKENYYKFIKNLLISLIKKDDVNINSLEELQNIEYEDFYNVNYEISRKLHIINSLIPIDLVLNNENKKKYSSIGLIKSFLNQ